MIGGTYVYESSSRVIAWDIGELGAKGEPDAQGQVAFSVRLKSGLPGGTLVSNEATVYFPSVPEKTPTGAVVNVVQPIAAVPQSVATGYGQPLAITLAGFDAANAPLTYAVTLSPTYGLLSGAPPALTYSPAANFSGPDRFAFTVSNGVMESQPADVLVEVRPSPADTIAPDVQWADPAGGAAPVPIAATAFMTDTSGAWYSPPVVAIFTEPMSATTVTSATVRLAAEDGWTLPAAVLYDSALHSAALYPRVALLPGTAYTVTVSQGAQDLAGNGLATVRRWSFCTRPVALADIQAIVARWRQAAAAPYDMDRDSRVTVADMMRITGRWGAGCP